MKWRESFILAWAILATGILFNVCALKENEIDHAQEYAAWTFGDGWRDLYIGDLLPQWNVLHPTCIIKVTDNAHDIAHHMYDEYERNFKEKEVK